MILRRPYAFLIKHFRLIHLVLFVLFGYITYKANNILSFFKEYIEYNGSVDVVVNEYISYIIFIAIVLVVIISVVIYLLMRYKKKPKLFYVILIIVSLISCILFLNSYSNIKVLETITVSGRELRLFRDLSRVNFWMLFIMCIPTLIRGLGFDIKKFNFSSDIHELKLDEKDSEEVEVNIDLSSDGIKRTGRKISRELKYYYAENKFFINIIIGIVIVILILIYPFNKYVVNRNLKEGEVFSTSNFDFKINETYISNRNRISINNSYVILKISVSGKIDRYKLNLNNFVLVCGNNKYVPSLKYYYYFSDLGVGYRENILDVNDYKDYILVYNINSEDADEKMIFDYVGKDRNINLSPKYID